MASYTAISHAVTFQTDYDFFMGLLAGKCCAETKNYSRWTWRNDDTQEQMKGYQWLCDFSLQPPCCEVGLGTVTEVTSDDSSLIVTDPTTTPDLEVAFSPALKSATTVVDVSASAEPLSGQVLTAVDGVTATWRNAPISGTYTPTIAGVLNFIL